MSGNSEEKTHPPSQQKLKKAREKGQVVTSRETLASVSTLAGLIYIYARRASIWNDFRTLFSVEPAPGLPLMQDLQERARIAFDLGMGILVPVLVLVIVLSVMGAMAISGGPLFSVQPLTPDFNKLNPAEGFKKMFGRAAWMRMLMHLVRIAAIGSLVAVMLRGQIGALLPAPPCGVECMSRITEGILGPLLTGIAAILILAGLFDYLVQRSEFMREQKMSISELKREYKEQEGDPLLKGHIQAQRREMGERPVGGAMTTAFIRDGNRELVGVRYVEGDTPAPYLTIRAKGAGAIRRALASRTDLTPGDSGAAIKELRGVAVGDWITTDEQIAAIMPHLSR